jgi:hypothetical protein
MLVVNHTNMGAENMARVVKRSDGDVIVDDETAPVADVYEVEPRDVDTTAATEPEIRHEMLARERAEFGGMKFGAAFFGWLTALGLGILLTAIIAAVGTAVLRDGAARDDNAIVSILNLGLTGAIAAGVAMFLAYLAGGYVAGRMARFSGARQGFAVWLWAVIAALLLSGLALLFGARFDVLARLDAFPRLPVSGEDVTLVGVVTAVAFAVISLVGAILGGLAGMRYHRRVDRAGLADPMA